VASPSFSYWQQTAPIISLSTEVPQTAEVAVIGGGLLGASVCYWLAREGNQVVLLERDTLASGATGRNGGFVRAGPAEFYIDTLAQLGHATASAILADTIENQKLLRQVVQEEQIACDYREPGTLRLAIRKAQHEHLKKEQEALQADGFPTTLLDRTHLQKLLPLPLAPDIRGGQFLPEQGLLHSARLVQGLVAAASRRGAHAAQAEVLALVPDGHAITLHTSRGTLQAGAVMVAVNAWTSTLLPGWADLILPVREQMLAYAPLAPIFPMGVSADVVTAEYWQQTSDGTILIGGCGSVAPGQDMGVWESDPTLPVQETLEQILPRLFPSLIPRLRVVQRWAGLMGCTTDNQPIVDQVPELPSTWIVGGFSGHGMPFGLRLGLLLASAITKGSPPSALHTYRLERPTLKRWEKGE
jgi:gamma-glutamylputrescine oxidase